MIRLLAAIKMDVRLQVRTNLYTIGIGVGVLVAVMLAWLAPPDQLSWVIPTVMLLVAGGSTLLYVAAMIIFEKEQGTLHATIVSPMRPAEYLGAKVITLTILATVESVVMFGGAMVLMWRADDLALPQLSLLLSGIVLIAILYTLIGIVLIVRFDKITDFLIPMSGVAVVLQLPFLYFLGWVKHPLLLLIPTSAPTLLMQSAYIQLTGWEWLYALGYTAVLLIGFTMWAHRAFYTHIIMKVG